MVRHWDAQEIEYLENKWGTVSIPSIARKLNRTVNAVRGKAYKLGLGSHFDSRIEISCRDLFTALGMCGDTISYRYTLNRWIEQFGFPVKKVKSVKHKYDFIDIDEFWEWAKDHQRILNFRYFEKYMLGSEPDWVDEKRAIDYHEEFKKTPWTVSEDKKLALMLSEYKYTYRDISQMLNRTEGAVKRRIFDLKLKQRPIRANNKDWTEEEMAVLLELHKRGHSYEYIADILGRSALAVRGKFERIHNPDYMIRYYRDKRSDEPYRWTSTKEGKMLRNAKGTIFGGD